MLSDGVEAQTPPFPLLRPGTIGSTTLLHIRFSWNMLEHGNFMETYGDFMETCTCSFLAFMIPMIPFCILLCHTSGASCNWQSMLSGVGQC